MEQFDQLLTCAICLDRYRNPKLLPCQHSFCMEPCMEGLVNYVTRMVKCPECRAEHRIPYQGVQQFPTNVTLQRFLELHIEITGELPDPTSGQVMERCAVCSEKNYCSTCTHCDKKVCNDCKDGHLDVVKREIARVNNQVRRTLPRLQDAISTLDKNAQQLTHNCTNVIEEVDSIYLRLSTALKSRLDGIKTEVETFMNKEMRTITALRANVEQEISNFQSNSDFAEKHMGSSELSSSSQNTVEWDDGELMDAKDIFLRTMEFIRNFETEQGDYHRRVRFFMPQDPNQLTSTLGNLGELTILPGPNSGNNSNSLSVPSGPSLSSGLMRSKSDHRVAAQFRAQEERYGMEDDTSGGRTGQRYFGERHNTSRIGSYASDRRTSEFDYDDAPADTGRRTRFRSRFMRHHDSGDSDNEPASRSVRFQGPEDGPAAAKTKERAKVIDTEDAARGPLSGITRLADSPRVIKRLQEVETKGRRKKPTPPSTLHIPAPAATTALHQPPSPRATAGRPTAASRQVSEEDEIAKIKKQNKSQEQASGASATASERKEASVPSTPTTGERPRYSVDHSSSQPSRSPAPSRQTSTTSEVKKESESTLSANETAEEARARRRSGYLDNSSTTTTTTTTAPETNGRASRAASRTGSPADGSTAGSTGSGDRSRRVGRVSTDRFQKSSSESSTSAESSTHSSPVRNTGAAFSASELKNRFQSGSATAGRRSSTGSQNGGDSSTSSAAMATTTTRSRFGNVNSTTSTPASTPSSRFSTAGSSTTTPSTTTTTTTANGTAAPHRFQSRFLGRAGTPTAEASRGSENNDSESSSSEESDSSESDDARTKPTTSTSSAAAAAANKDAARTDIGPLLARSAQARDTSNSIQPTTTTTATTSTGSSYSRTRGSGAGLTSTPPTTSSGRHYGTSSRFLGPSDTGSSGLSRSRTGSSLATDLENKYPLTSKYLNRSRANLDDYGSGASGSSSRSTAGRYGSGGSYQSRFLNKSKSSAALAADTESDVASAADEPSACHDDEAGSDVAASLAASTGAVSGDERYPSGRSRYAALKDRRSRLARSKSSHEVAQQNGNNNEDGPNNNYQHHQSALAVDTGAAHSSPSSGEPASPGAEASGSSLSNWARYLKNKYGPRNKDAGGGGGDGGEVTSAGNGSASSSAPGAGRQPLQQSRFSRSRSIAGSSGTVAPAGGGRASDEQQASGVVDSLITSPSHHQYMQKRKMLLKFGTRGSEAGAFTWPRGVAVGPDNTIVVADSSNHRVQVFDSTGHFVKEFGYYGNGEGEFDCLAGVAINRIGQYIIADRYNHRIQVFDPSGRFLRVFGSQGSADGKFSYPWGVTTDALGFIYVCDKENHRVQVFQSDGTFVGKFGSMGNRPGQLEHPHYIAVSSTNRVIVSDSNNHRIQVFDVNGKVVTSFGQEGADEGQFKFPRGVAVDDQGYIVVADSGNNRIQVFTADGVFVKAFGCWGSGDGEFKGLEGIAVLPNGNIVCADRENHRIQVF